MFWIKSILKKYDLIIDEPSELNIEKIYDKNKNKKRI